MEHQGNAHLKVASTAIPGSTLMTTGIIDLYITVFFVMVALSN